VDGQIPDSIVWRKNKLGWPVPEKEWLEGDLKPWATKKIEDSAFLKTVIRNNFTMLFKGNKTKYVVRKLNLAIWHELFFQTEIDELPKLGIKRNQ